MKCSYQSIFRNFAAALIALVTNVATAQTNFWQPTDGPARNDVRALASHTSGDIFAATYGGDGIFRSRNNGDSWTPVNSGLTNRSVLVLAINKSTGHIFAGTGFFFFGWSGAAVFRSTDNGENWSKVKDLVADGDTTAVFSLALNASGHIFAGTEKVGVLRSTDNGSTWQKINTGLTSLNIRALVINTTGEIFVGTANGVFRSSNNGDTWTPMNTGLSHPSVLALTINTNGHLFAGTKRPTFFSDVGGAIFRSTDNGANWRNVKDVPAHSFLSLAIDAAGNIFAGRAGGPVCRSIDNGDNWREINLGLTSLAVYSLAVNSAGQLLAGTSFGIFRSTDNGGTWKEANKGLSFVLDAASLVIKKTGEIFAGSGNIFTSGRGVFRSTDKGSTWTLANNGLENTNISTLALNANEHIFAGTFGDGIFSSTDNGAQWTKATPAGLTNLSILSIAFNASGDLFTGTSGDGIFRLLNNTTRWDSVNTGLTNRFVRSLVINANGAIFAGTLGGGSGVFRSVDKGGRWTAINDGLTNLSVRSLALKANGDLFAGTVGGGVFRLLNNASTWTRTGLTNQDIRSLVINPNGAIFAGTTGGGVFCSTDNGSQWIAVNGGLTSLTVLALALNHSTGEIYAGTDKNGVFRSEGLQAPVITHTLLSPQSSGQVVNLSTEVTSNTSVDSVALHYRSSGSANFTPVVMAKSGNAYQATIPGNVVTSRGVEYFIRAVNQKRLPSRLPVAGVFSMQVRVNNETKPAAQPGGSQQTAYRLISVPLDLDNKSPQAVLEDDLGQYQDTQWRFSELVANQSYVEFPGTAAMTPGKAFWLLVKDAGKIIDTGAGRSNATNQAFKIALHAGWNFVGNPFNFPIPLNNKLSLKSGKPVVLRAYNGSWNDPNITPVGSFIPFEGYAVFNELNSSDTLLVNPDLTAGSNAFRHQALVFEDMVLMNEDRPVLFKPSQLSNTQPLKGQLQTLWSIRILAQCQEARDVDNTAAISAGALRDYDERDQPEPPPVGEYVSVYFPHREWEPPTPNYCADVRPEFSQGEIWAVEVTTNIRDKVHLTFDGIEQVPEEFEIWVVDEALHLLQNLREKNNYVFAGSSADHPKRLKLIVGRQDFIDAKLAAAKLIPATYELSQNFPNPFWSEATSRFAGNPATTMRYGLPQVEKVTLQVYNLLGEEVVILLKDERREAGYHAAIWDGRNRAGRQVASGVYVYRLRAGSLVLTKKMTLVR